MSNGRARLRVLACGLAVPVALLLVSCSSIPPFNQRPVVTRAPAAPQVLSSHSTRGHLPPCPQELIAQTQWLPRNMARVRLGFSKLQVVGILGDPAHAETFSLRNGAVVEVLFYHTAESICRASASDVAARDRLMPLVFQDDRLLGYGPNYYRDFIVPSLRPVAVKSMPEAGSGALGDVGGALPQGRVEMYEAAPLSAAPARSGRWQQEDLPTPPSANYTRPPVVRGGNGYTGDMTSVPSSPAMVPVGYRVPAAGASRGSFGYTDQGLDEGGYVGRGEPLH